ncbi:methylenetetrahydrofolate reductase C-terminal domain-containing protein [Thermodesulforhabdus norvegica]|uniref:Methylene-tetrahydrofolate reductase C terminal n=1 Tax=Thermodesulforhabdus norvegica TaxID=39841 RepID=A0A1I4REU4_9BACT|nr:methylenetetrahydrofolate reductase C-terminal domain-containing protein [Thermodesulforhabdus norvegica]SFM50802.1 Methylene-tetrahydrofolate reductase C terminal [Thermodesulforhabdus norvegica]
MVVAERKPIKEILEMMAGYKKILLVGCKGCVTVCCAGGTKEVGILASALRIARKKDGNPIEIVEYTLERQCDPEYIEQVSSIVEGDGVEAILSMACSVGPQYMAKRYAVPVYPALNTTFIGGSLEHGVWAEFCQACGNCVIHHFGGICPVSRCSKSLFNGPCGGSAGGKCEISKEVDCAWHLIYERMKALGRLDDMAKIFPIKDWSTSRDGGPRKVVREDMRL